MGLPHCPNCRKNLVHQSRRQGLIETLGGLLCLSLPFAASSALTDFSPFNGGGAASSTTMTVESMYGVRFGSN